MQQEIFFKTMKSILVANIKTNGSKKIFNNHEIMNCSYCQLYFEARSIYGNYKSSRVYITAKSLPNIIFGKTIILLSI